MTEAMEGDCGAGNGNVGLEGGGPSWRDIWETGLHTWCKKPQVLGKQLRERSQPQDGS